MAAKLVQVSDDDGSNWHTLPGASGQIAREKSNIGDTIFGQTFGSVQPGLITASITANAFYKGFAGYVADIKQPGTPTATTGESMTLVSGKTFAIDDTAKEIFDRSATIVVYDNAIDHTADVLDINYLHGEVTFKAAYSVTTPITIDVTYLPTVDVGKARGFTLTQTADAIETTDFPTAQSNGGFRTWDPGLRSVALDLSGIYDATDNLNAELIAVTELIIEINNDGSGLSIARGFFKVSSDNQQGDVGALEEVTDNLSLFVPIEGTNPAVNTPFEWRHDALTTLSQAIQIILQAWQSESKIDFRYLPDGINGDKADSSVVTDVSLSSGLDAMNEFSCSLMADGALTAVP